MAVTPSDRRLSFIGLLRSSYRPARPWDWRLFAGHSKRLCVAPGLDLWPAVGWMSWLQPARTEQRLKFLEPPSSQHRPTPCGSLGSRTAHRRQAHRGS